MGREIKKLNILILVTAFLLLLFCQPVLAADPPDSLEILSAQAYRNLVKDGDMLIVFHYNIHYATTPDEPANDLFIFRVLSPDGEELGVVLAYAYYSKGYEQGGSAFYWETSTPTWGAANKVQIVGNPSQFSPPPELNYILSPSDYCGSTLKEENQKALADYLIDMARDLEVNWDKYLIGETQAGTVLNEDGEAYFRGAIPGLQVMCPQIFYIQSITPEYEERDWETGQATTYVERYKGTWVGDALDGVGDLLHVEPTMITGGFILLAMLGTMVLSHKFFDTTTPGLVLGLCLFVMGGVLGFIPMAMIALGSLAIAMFLLYVFFFKPAT